MTPSPRWVRLYRPDGSNCLFDRAQLASRISQGWSVKGPAVKPQAAATPKEPVGEQPPSGGPGLPDEDDELPEHEE